MTCEPCTPQGIPADTAEYVYRPVTRLELDAGMGVPVVYTEYQQIWISQP